LILSLRNTEDSPEKSKKNWRIEFRQERRRAIAIPNRGKCLMAENIAEKADAQVAESIRKLTRATSAMAEAIDEGVGAIKLAVKRSGDLAEEMIDDTTQRVQRHPVETMVATFTMGLIVGGLIGWMVSRK
jgi:hypothetical protein